MAMLSPKQRASKRRQLLKRDGPNCWLCGTLMPEGDMTIDHAIPSSKGGSNCVDNLRLAHGRCNVQRGNLDAIKKAKQPASQERAKRAGVAIAIEARSAATTGAARQGESAGPKGIARKSLNWDRIERPSPSPGSLTYCSKQRAWVDVRSGKPVQVAA